MRPHIRKFRRAGSGKKTRLPVLRKRRNSQRQDSRSLRQRVLDDCFAYCEISGSEVVPIRSLYCVINTVGLERGKKGTDDVGRQANKQV